MTGYPGPGRRLTLLGEEVANFGDEVFVVSYPGPVSLAVVDAVKRAWRDVMGDKRLVVLDSGAHIGLLVPPNPTPIFGALAAEYGWQVPA